MIPFNQVYKHWAVLALHMCIACTCTCRCHRLSGIVPVKPPFLVQPQVLMYRMLPDVCTTPYRACISCMKQADWIYVETGTLLTLFTDWHLWDTYMTCTLKSDPNWVAMSLYAWFSRISVFYILVYIFIHISWAMHMMILSPPSAPAMGEVLGEREDAHITQ